MRDGISRPVYVLRSTMTLIWPGWCVRCSIIPTLPIFVATPEAALQALQTAPHDMVLVRMEGADVASVARFVQRVRRASG